MALLAQIEAVIHQHKAVEIPIGEYRPASVLMPLYWKNGELYTLFTRRTSHLKDHSGEISFPGGGRHDGDTDILETALRECEEEVGLDREDVTVFGRLDDVVSSYGYHVVPWVGLIPSDYPFKTDPFEVESLIELPLRKLRDPAVFSEEDWHHKGRVLPVYFYRLEGHEIWGLTARVLTQFLQWTRDCDWTVM